jgi:phosphoglycolate phosphatase
MIALVVFDLDGTLVDSRRDLAEAANDVLADFRAGPLSEDAIGRMVGDGAATLVRRAFEAVGQLPPPDALARFLRHYNRRLLRFTRAYAGMEEVLKAADARAMLSILTNKPLHATCEILEGLNLSAYFPSDRVLGGDGPHPRKPDPAGLHQLMAAAGVSPRETLLVGDSQVDWETARAAGTRVCMARYGFGFETFPLERLEPADAVIDEPGELLELL